MHDLFEEMTLGFSLQNNSSHRIYNLTKLMLCYLTDIRIQTADGYEAFLEW